MPTLTGSVADVTGVALAPAQIRQVFVKAPGERPSLADGGVLIVSAPVQLGSSGSLSVTLEPGPAVLTIDTYAGGPDVYDLYVTSDMTLLSEAVDEAAPEHDRLWAESVMVQLRKEAVEAAEQAALDREQTGLDRVATSEDRTQTGLDRTQTGLDRVATGQDRTATGEDRTQTGLDREQARLDRVATGQDRTQTGLDRSAAAGSATAAAGFADDAEQWAKSFGLTATSTTGAPGTSASVTVTGSGPEYGLALTVPRGDKGAKGDDGEVSQAALDAAVASLVDNAPEALNTLSELATSLGNDPNFATTVSTEIGLRAKTSDVNTALADKSDVGHTHQVSDLVTLDPVTSKTGRQVLTYDSGYAEWKRLESTSSLLNDDSSEVEQAISGSTFGAALRARGLSHGQITNPASTVVGPVSGERVRQAANAAISAREWTGTQAQYDALPTKNPLVTYYVTDA